MLKTTKISISVASGLLLLATISIRLSMSRIGLLDIDGHNYPNLAIMKLSSWHKAQGDDVEWAIPFNHYDTIYRSKIFTFSPDDLTYYSANQVIRGGYRLRHQKQVA